MISRPTVDVGPVFVRLFKITSVRKPFWNGSQTVPERRTVSVLERFQNGYRTGLKRFLNGFGHKVT